MLCNAGYRSEKIGFLEPLSNYVNVFLQLSRKIWFYYPKYNSNNSRSNINTTENASYIQPQQQQRK